MEYNKEILKQQLIKFVEIHRRVPGTPDFKIFRDILANKHVFIKHFGSLNKAIIEAGLKPNRLRNIEHSCIICKFCSIEFITRDSEAKFCSRLCYHSFKKNEYREVLAKTQELVIKTCLECNSPFEFDKKSRKGDFCNFICRSTNQMKNISIGEMSRYTEQNKYRAIRDKAHNFYNTFGKSCSCANCGYSKHVELCHIKAITDFDKSESVWECNKPENIIFLCPNCQWELDYGDLSVEDIKS